MEIQPTHEEHYMDYIKIRFGNDFGTSDSGFDKTIEDMFRSMSPMFSLSERVWKPQMDIYETPGEVIILAEIAGVDKDNLEVEISSRAIRIRGNREEIPRVENTTYRLAEIQYGIFERILYLPALIDTDKVSASYLNGFLQVRLAKVSQDKAHKISISEG
jgi:HSP20 family protein